MKNQVTVLSSELKTKYFTQNSEFKFIFCFRILWYCKSAQVENTIKFSEWKSSITLQVCLHLKKSWISKQEVSEYKIICIKHFCTFAVLLISKQLLLKTEHWAASTFNISQYVLSMLSSAVVMVHIIIQQILTLESENLWRWN